MKVALLLPGLNRSAIKCYEALNRCLLSKYDVDIYIHTWDNIHTDEASIDEVCNLYKPKSIIVEDYKSKTNDLNTKFQGFKIEGSCIPERSISMFYKNSQCFKMVDDSYDIYIRSRIDVLLEDNFNIEDLDVSCINVPNPNVGKDTTLVDNFYSSYVNDSHGIIDAIAAGNYENMSKYMNAYDNLNYMCNDLGLMFHPEYLTLQNLKIQNVNISRFDLNFCLYRKAGS